MGNTSKVETKAQNVAFGQAENLVRVLEIFRNRLLKDLETVTPAIVIEYDRNTHIALVQPLVMRPDGYGTSLVLPQFKVTVRRLYAGDYLIDVPIHPFDTGWVVASAREATNVKSQNPDSEGENKGVQEPVTGDMHRYWMGYFIPDRWGDAYMPIKEKEKTHLTDFDDPTAEKKKEDTASPTYVEKKAKKVESTYGDIEKAKSKFFELYKTPGKDTAEQRAKDDLAEIPQPDGNGGLIPPPIGGPIAREFNTDYDRLVIQSKDKKQRITMGQKDIKVYSSNLIYVNSQKDIIAYARENVDVHVGERLKGADTTQGKVNVFSNQDIKVTCASMKKDGKIDVCSNGSMSVHAREVTIDGDAPNQDDPQQMPRVDEMAKTEKLPTNIKVHANNVKIACTMTPDAKGVAGTGKVEVSADTEVDVHSPIVNIDGGKPNADKPVSGDATKQPGVVNILGKVNITGDTKITGALTVNGTGTVTATTEVTANTIALTKHTHTGCQGGSTGAPIG